MVRSRRNRGRGPLMTGLLVRETGRGPRRGIPGRLFRVSRMPAAVAPEPLSVACREHRAPQPRIDPPLGVGHVAWMERKSRRERLARRLGGARKLREVRPRRLRVHVVGGDRRHPAPVVEPRLDQAGEHPRAQVRRRLDAGGPAPAPAAPPRWSTGGPRAKAPGPPPSACRASPGSSARSLPGCGRAARGGREWRAATPRARAESPRFRSGFRW